MFIPLSAAIMYVFLIVYALFSRSSCLYWRLSDRPAPEIKTQTWIPTFTIATDSVFTCDHMCVFHKGWITTAILSDHNIPKSIKMAENMRKSIKIPKETASFVRIRTISYATSNPTKVGKRQTLFQSEFGALLFPGAGTPNTPSECGQKKECQIHYDSDT